MKGLYLENILIWIYEEIKSGDKKEYRKQILKMILTELNKNISENIFEVKIKGFKIIAHMYTDNDNIESIYIDYNLNNYTCRISFAGKYELNIKLNKQIILENI
jgi:hypothetical protein